MAKKRAEKPVFETGYEPIKRADGGYSYRCQITIGGNLERKTFRTLKAAKVWKNKMLATRDENRANGIKYFNGMYFEDLCNKFLQKRVGVKKSTKQSYISTIKTHLAEPFGEMAIKDIKKNDAIDLQCELVDKGHSNGGVNKIIALFASIMDFAVKMDYLEKNPVKGIKNLKTDKSDYQYWTETEVKQFLTAIKDNFYSNVFQFALNTGLRRGEICGLLWKNIIINGDTGQMSFNEQLTPKMFRELVKGHTLSTRPLAPGAIRILNGIERKDPDSYIFTAKRGGPIAPNILTSEWKKAQKKANMKKQIKFHGARHTFASFLASKNVSIKRISQLLDHKDTKVTERYSHLSTADGQDTVKIIDFCAEMT